MKNWLIIQASKAKKLASEKVLTLTLTKLNQLLMQTAVDTMGTSAGPKHVFEGGMSLGHEFMMELSAQLEGDFERIPAYGEAAWIMFAGRTPTKQSYEKVEVEGETVYIYTLQDDDSPFCRSISFPMKFCWFPAGAYQGAAQTWSALTMNGDYHVICRETKCKAVGDDCCELTLLVLRKELPLEFVKTHWPHFFVDSDSGFVDY
ncbi:MAG: hypothetical protein HXY34_12625 [Candidatus Thorarchaeota archaeon]|nr:hypothetical protein [Candidatus Thorarchaeota archaeon]